MRRSRSGVVDVEPGVTFDLPFRGSVAVAAGAVTWDRLRGPGFRRLVPDTYVAARTPRTLRQFLEGLQLWCPDAVIAGPAAAVWCGADTAEAPVGCFLCVGGDPIGDVDVVVRRRTRPPPGTRIRRDALEADEVVVHRGLRLTSPARTGLDLIRHLGRDAAVVAADAVAHRHGVTVDDVAMLLDRHMGERGLTAARRSLRVLEPACRTPLVSRVRLALRDHRIRVPQVGGFVSEGGVLVGCADLTWPDRRYAVLCDERDLGMSMAEEAVGFRTAGWSVYQVGPEQAVDLAEVARAIAYGLRAAGRRQCGRGRVAGAP
jgi:hypothetical protein